MEPYILYCACCHNAKEVIQWCLLANYIGLRLCDLEISNFLKANLEELNGHFGMLFFGSAKELRG